MLRTGIDMVETGRMESTIQRYGERFTGRVFTPNELAEVGENISSLAARFAAKEAVSKALGTGIGTVGWKEIEILRGPERQPVLHLHGSAARLAAELGLTQWALSLSHTQTHAVAVVVAMK
jgi:holo-[acyl-carrier protein] synthase